MACPAPHLMRQMGIHPARAGEYLARHGTATAERPFGENVWIGLWDMFANYVHRHKWHSPPVYVWVWSPGSSPPSKTQMRVPRGDHPADHLPWQGLGWFPGLAELDDGGETALVSCIGQMYLQWPPWHVHVTRTRTAVGIQF